MMKSGSLKLYRWILTAAALLLVSEPALAEKRVALVLGNSAYQNVAPLTNPANDSATALPERLCMSTFSVISDVPLPTAPPMTV